MKWFVQSFTFFTKGSHSPKSVQLLSQVLSRVDSLSDHFNHLAFYLLVTWSCVAFHLLTWSLLAFHLVTWSLMGLYLVTWSFMGGHLVTRSPSSFSLLPLACLSHAPQPQVAVSLLNDYHRGALFPVSKHFRQPAQSSVSLVPNISLAQSPFPRFTVLKGLLPQIRPFCLQHMLCTIANS